MAAKKKTEKKPKTPQGAKANADTKVEGFNQSLRVELDEDGVLDRSRRLAHLLTDRELKKQAATAASAHIRAQIKEIDAEIGRLSTEVTDGATYQDVRCERRFLYRVGKVEEVRLDTNETTFERPMSLSERQVPLDLDAKRKAKDKLKEKVKAAVGDGEEAPDVPGTDEPPESSPIGDNDADETDDLDDEDTGDIGDESGGEAAE